jgi:hypothetical protein
VSEETVGRVRQSSLRSPKKSVRHGSRELKMSTMTVWKVLQKRLKLKLYHLHFVQFLQSFCAQCVYYVYADLYDKNGPIFQCHTSKLCTSLEAHIL